MRSRLRILAPIAILVAVAMIAGCAGAGIGPEPTMTPGPVKTLRPTFTHTPAQPTEPPATATPEIPPTATPAPATPTPEVPPTETPEPTPEAAALTVTSQTANLRSGPGTGFGRVGQVSAGETYQVTGKNPAGDWWEIDFDGKTAWIYSQMATVAGAELVAVAEKVPVLPTAAPRPTSRPAPKPAQPAPQPAPVAANAFAQAGLEFRAADDTNFDWVTFWGRLGKTNENPVTGGYKLRVSGPSGSKEVPFGEVWEMAYSGQRASEFRYNAKVELPRSSGGFTAVVVDPGGNVVSDQISGTLVDRTHDVIMTWWKR